MKPSAKRVLQAFLQQEERHRNLVSRTDQLKWAAYEANRAAREGRYTDMERHLQAVLDIYAQ